MTLVKATVTALALQLATGHSHSPSLTTCHWPEKLQSKKWKRRWGKAREPTCAVLPRGEQEHLSSGSGWLPYEGGCGKEPRSMAPAGWPRQAGWLPPNPDSPPAERYLPEQGSHVLRRDPRINSIHPDAHVKSTPILGPLSLPAHIIAPPPSPFEFSGIKSRLPPRDLSISTILLTTTILSKSKRSLLFWKIIRVVLVFSYCFQHDISCCRKTKKQKKLFFSFT